MIGFRLGRPRIFYRGGQWNCGGAIRGVGATPFDAYCGLLEKWCHPESCLPPAKKNAELTEPNFLRTFARAAFLTALSVAVLFVSLAVYFHA